MNSVRSLRARFVFASLVCFLCLQFYVMTPPLLAAAPFQNAGTSISNDQTVQSSAANRKSKLPDLIATGQRGFDIPFSVNANRTGVVEVILRMSTDRGQTWQEHSRRNAAANQFPFSSAEDGEYWFAIQTVDRDGSLKPPDRALKVELRIAIDTARPTFEFDVRPDAAGRIVGSWTAVDANIDPCSLTIQYQSENGPADQWYTVPTSTCGKANHDTLRDELAWWPETASRTLTIRAQISDLAGNATEAVRTMVIPQVAGFGNPGVPSGTQPGIVGTQPATQQQAYTTEYQRSRMPVALRPNYGEFDQPAQAVPATPTRSSEARTPRHQPSNPDLSRVFPPAPQPTLRRNFKTTNGSNRNVSNPTTQRLAEQSGVARPLTNDPAPQPPRSPNRYAQVSSSSASVPVDQSRTYQETSQWKSRSVPGGQTGVAQASTQSGQSTQAATQLASATPVAAIPVSPPAVATVPEQRQSDRTSAATTWQSATGGVAKNQGGPAASVARRQELTAPAQPARVPQSVVTPSTRNAGSSSGQWSASTTGQVQTAVPTTPTALDSGPQLQSLKKMARATRSRLFQLDYDIAAIGPEGVKAVELWMTRDGGSTWKRWTTDDDRRSPVNVEVDAEGIFGFRILVVSNEGLRGRSPQPGDPADIWVNVDTQQPQAQITGVPYGRGLEAGRLIVQWQANDSNLSLRPIKISYSPRADGPWTTIEDGIRNEGQFAWKPSTDIPDQVFLKLEARDTAGNVKVHQLQRPIDISGLIPRGHIRSVRPLGIDNQESIPPTGDSST